MGRILVNGQTETRTEQKINPEQDEIQVDNQVILYAKWEYYMLNKPRGVVSATEDKRYPTVISLLTDAKRTDLFPVGRLDKDTEGLLLITNDGELAHRLLSPKNHVDKVYYAKIQGKLPEDSQKRVEEGLVLEDGVKTLPGKLNIIRPGEICLTIQEGKFHQVKRMVEALGSQVLYLKRLSMGSLCLDLGLAPGEYRPLTEEELYQLKNSLSETDKGIKIKQ